MVNLRFLPTEEFISTVIIPVAKSSSLERPLEEFIRKLDYRFQHELTLEERGAWKNAMEFLAGKPGIFPNDMRHDTP